jgi:hypothetical protein
MQPFRYKCTKKGTHNGEESLCPLTLKLILVREELHVFVTIYDVSVRPRAVFDTLPRPDATRFSTIASAQLLTVPTAAEMLL